MKRKIFIALLALIAVFACVLGLTACGGDDIENIEGETGGQESTDILEYEGNVENGVTVAYSVSGLNTSNLKNLDISNLNIEIPSVHDGKPVTSIRHGAFSGRIVFVGMGGDGNVSQIEVTIKSVTVPDSVTSIGWQAFYKCIGLESITLPDSIESIGELAFDETAYYSDADNWENGVLYIGKYLINASPDIAGNYEIKPGTLTIADGAIFCCNDLTGVILPESLRNIGYQAFGGCSNLASLNIPKGVKNIAGYAFIHCSRLEEISVAAGNSVYHSYGNCLIETQSKTLILGCANSEIPDDGSVTAIGECAFADCIELRTITIPEGIISIGDGAFELCSNLTEIVIPNSVKSIGNYAFAECVTLKSVLITEKVTSIGAGAFQNCFFLRVINYLGTKEQWEQLEKGEYWDSGTREYTVHCSNGNVSKEN